MWARKGVHGYGLMRTVNPSQVRSGSCKTKKPQTLLTVSMCSCEQEKLAQLISSQLTVCRKQKNRAQDFATEGGGAMLDHLRRGVGALYSQNMLTLAITFLDSSRIFLVVFYGKEHWKEKGYCIDSSLYLCDNSEVSWGGGGLCSGGALQLDPPLRCVEQVTIHHAEVIGSIMSS